MPCVRVLSKEPMRSASKTALISSYRFLCSSGRYSYVTGSSAIATAGVDVVAVACPTGRARMCRRPKPPPASGGGATRGEPGSPWDGCGPGSSVNGPQVFWHRAHALVLAGVPPDLYLIRKGGELPPIVSCMVNM